MSIAVTKLGISGLAGKFILPSRMLAVSQEMSHDFRQVYKTLTTLTSFKFMKGCQQFWRAVNSCFQNLVISSQLGFLWYCVLQKYLPQVHSSLFLYIFLAPACSCKLRAEISEIKSLFECLTVSLCFPRFVHM